LIYGWVTMSCFHPKAKPARLALFQRHGEHQDSRHAGVDFGTDDPEFERFGNGTNANSPP